MPLKAIQNILVDLVISNDSTGELIGFKLSSDTGLTDCSFLNIEYRWKINYPYRFMFQSQSFSIISQERFALTFKMYYRITIPLGPFLLENSPRSYFLMTSNQQKIMSNRFHKLFRLSFYRVQDMKVPRIISVLLFGNLDHNLLIPHFMLVSQGLDQFRTLFCWENEWTSYLLFPSSPIVVIRVISLKRTALLNYFEFRKFEQLRRDSESNRTV